MSPESAYGYKPKFLDHHCYDRLAPESRQLIFDVRFHRCYVCFEFQCGRANLLAIRTACDPLQTSRWKGFDFLGYYFSPDGISCAHKKDRCGKR